MVCFAGNPDAPDGLFPNNAFATVPGRLVVGRMRHPVRRREAARDDIRAFFRDVLGYAQTDLSGQPHPCALNGALAIGRASGRERGCPYGSISGVPGTLKKKT